MEYITTGDRIAVENFEIGSIYKVTFLNETEVYFMCCGKGKDFVMMMSNEPRLFSLTMLSAAEVAAIDDYTPLPPPTPPTNLLQYQTGESPFTFTTTDTELFSWYIKGPAGEKTANLFSYANAWNGTYQYVVYTPIDSSSFRINGQATGGKQITKALDMTGTYRLTITIEGTENDSGSHSVNAYVDGTRYILTFSKTITTSTITFTGHLTAIDTIINNTFDGNIIIKIMLTEGETQVSYEPYGYKIPILCNTTTSIIYIEEALGENDILYSTDTTYKIVTELGENLLQVQSETQPSEMQIVYKWEFEYE